MTTAGTSPIAIRPRRDHRVVTYGLVGLGCVLAALFSGRAEALVLALPPLVSVLAGLRARGEAVMSAQIVAVQQCVEGDELAIAISVSRPEGFAVEARFEPNERAFSVTGPPDSLSMFLAPGDADRPLPIVLRADAWGRHDLGRLYVRLNMAWSLLRWDGPSFAAPAVRVLPHELRLREIMDPAASQASSGVHVARRYAGHGTEFAEIRPYQPGDRLRSLNWAATARRRAPQVNSHHPERSGDVLIAIDTFNDGYGDTTAIGDMALRRAARAGWAVCRQHLGVQDRVGLLSAGRTITWLTPRSGTRARYQLLDALLTVGGTAPLDEQEWAPVHEDRVPPNALVVGLTPLWTDQFARSLVNLHRRGRAVAVVAVDTLDLVAPDDAPYAADVARLNRLLWQERAAAVARDGVAVAVWGPHDRLESVLTRLQSGLRSRLQVRRG